MRPYELNEDAPYLENAYHLARMAEAVYRDDPAEDCPDLAQAFPRLTTFCCGRVFGLVAGDSRHVVLVFRGTEAIERWGWALSGSQIGWKTGRVHQGLAEALDSVWRAILAAFYDVDAHDRTIWLTGHSLGGALATLAAQRLCDEGFDVHLVCTFGAPRVLDPVAARAFKTPLYRFVNNEDMVPGIPWPTLLDRYEHAGELVQILASGKIAAKRHSLELARRIERAETIGEGIFPSGIIHDHDMGNYVSKLEGHL